MTYVQLEEYEDQRRTRAQNKPVQMIKHISHSTTWTFTNSLTLHDIYLRTNMINQNITRWFQFQPHTHQSQGPPPCNHSWNPKNHTFIQGERKRTRKPYIQDKNVKNPKNSNVKIKTKNVHHPEPNIKWIINNMQNNWESHIFYHWKHNIANHFFTESDHRAISNLQPAKGHSQIENKQLQNAEITPKSERFRCKKWSEVLTIAWNVQAKTYCQKRRRREG